MTQKFTNGKLAWTAPVFLIQLLVIVFRLKTEPDYHWWITFIPLWIWNGTLLFFIGWCANNTSKREGDYFSWEVFAMAIFAACSITFEILLSIELTKPGSISVIIITLPLIFMLAAWTILACKGPTVLQKLGDNLSHVTQYGRGKLRKKHMKLSQRECNTL